MSAYYYVRGPRGAVNNAEQFSSHGANVSLAAGDWDASEDSGDDSRYLCPRGFIPKAEGVLAVKPLDDDNVVNYYVLKGILYPIAIKHIDQSACSAALQIADAVALVY
jgi:hypothetical protein